MTFEQLRAGAVSSWMLVVVLTGIIIGVATPAGWGILLAIAVIPALIAMRFWIAPPATMSQRIHTGRR